MDVGAFDGVAGAAGAVGFRCAYENVPFFAGIFVSSFETARSIASSLRENRWPVSYLCPRVFAWSKATIFLCDLASDSLKMPPTSLAKSAARSGLSSPSRRIGAGPSCGSPPRTRSPATGLRLGCLSSSVETRTMPAAGKGGVNDCASPSPPPMAVRANQHCSTGGSSAEQSRKTLARPSHFVVRRARGARVVEIVHALAPHSKPRASQSPPFCALLTSTFRRASENVLAVEPAHTGMVHTPPRREANSAS